jgi:hypothetical protein
MVQLKRVLVVCLAFAGALVLAELFVRYLVHYPVYGVSERVYGMRAPGISSNLFSPYSENWSVEGGNRVYRRNNLGLTGVDISLSAGTKHVFVLGDSYIQSYEVAPESMATSRFNKHLIERYTDWSVVNLGRSAFDPYDCFYRSVYFESTLLPSAVFLVVAEGNLGLFAHRKHPLLFPSIIAHRTDSSLFIRIHQYARNHSSLINLIARVVYENQAFFNQNNEGDAAPEGEPHGPSLAGDSLVMNEMFQCVDQFNGRYGQRFVLISIARDQDLNRSLREYCSLKHVAFESMSINEARFKIGRLGHLNSEGQNTLGDLLYDSFAKHIAEQSR